MDFCGTHGRTSIASIAPRPPSPSSRTAARCHAATHSGREEEAPDSHFFNGTAHCVSPKAPLDPDHETRHAGRD